MSFWGTEAKVRFADIFTKQQLAFLETFMEVGGNKLLRMRDDDPEREKFAQNQFSQNVMPSIMERFRGAGGGQGQNMASSGLGRMLSGGGRQLSEDMANKRYDRGYNRALGLTQMGLGQRTQPLVTPGSQGIAGAFARGLGEGIPKMFSGGL
jgi:hypothetical protein